MPAGTRGLYSRFAPCAAVAALLATVAFPACAQSLALSYGLEGAKATQLPRAAAVVDRCSGLTWAAAIEAACNAVHALAQRVVGASSAQPAGGEVGKAPPAPRRVAVAGAYSAADAAPARYELPALGSPVEARVMRAAAAGEDSGRGVDVNFRFGSRYHLTPGGSNNWDAYKYRDVNAENRLQTNKNVGVELTVPFQ